MTNSTSRFHRSPYLAVLYLETGKWDSPPDGTVPFVDNQRVVCNKVAATSPSGR